MGGITSENLKGIQDLLFTMWAECSIFKMWILPQETVLVDALTWMMLVWSLIDAFCFMSCLSLCEGFVFFCLIKNGIWPIGQEFIDKSYPLPNMYMHTLDFRKLSDCSNSNN